MNNPWAPSGKVWEHRRWHLPRGATTSVAPEVFYWDDLDDAFRSDDPQEEEAAAELKFRRTPQGGWRWSHDDGMGGTYRHEAHLVPRRRRARNNPRDMDDMGIYPHKEHLMADLVEGDLARVAEAGNERGVGLLGTLKNLGGGFWELTPFYANQKPITFHVNQVLHRDGFRNDAREGGGIVDRWQLGELTKNPRQSDVDKAWWDEQKAAGKSNIWIHGYLYEVTENYPRRLKEPMLEDWVYRNMVLMDMVTAGTPSAQDHLKGRAAARADGRKLGYSSSNPKYDVAKRNPRQADVGLYQDLLAHLRALQWFAWTTHWTSKGQNFYGDHLLLQRLYEGKGGGPDINEQIDQLGERMVAYFGSEAINPVRISSRARSILAHTGDLSPLQRLYALEDNTQRVIKVAWDAEQKSGDERSLGIDDFLMSLANERDTARYLLKQRLGGGVKKNPRKRARRRRK